MDNMLVLFLLLLPTAAQEGSHSFLMLASFIKGESPFPQLSFTVMLDDVRVMYYNGDTDTFFARGNTTNEDSLFDPELKKISDYIDDRWAEVDYLYKPKVVRAIQRLAMCELKDNGEPGQMFLWNAYQAITLNEFHWYNNSFKYTSQVVLINFNSTSLRFKNIYYPLCIKTLKGCLDKRRDQVNRKVKPTVRFFQKPGGSQVSCLATGFYPRHINLTLFRDGEPVDDGEVTTGDLLPNDDGTYQMRKILEIDEEEPRDKYTCSATHVSLDNKLDVILDFDNRTPLKLVAILIPTVLGLVLISVTVAAIIQAKKRHAVTIVPVILWRRQLAATVKHLNSVGSGHSNDSMIKE
ncbi:hypothetical protein E1301_Tti003835 [Triplophysa tibetana]|uniref:Ig-like domain-containing protein n=1 Tax=Triplophysa tibetana TaxID=1572043 RepID=A0A5A9PVU3_9TELE|nr:hypothetical protein E1301_Tti003835 [Triplophysa tibetana]